MDSEFGIQSLLLIGKINSWLGILCFFPDKFFNSKELDEAYGNFS